MEIAGQVSKYINDETFFNNIKLENLEPDLYYLIGKGYAYQKKLMKAKEFFHQAINALSLDNENSILIKGESPIIYHILCISVITWDEELLKKLVHKVQDINVEWIPPGYSGTPLHIAAEDLKTEIPYILLEKGANPFAVSKICGLTPIHNAVSSLNFKLLEKICEITKSLEPNHDSEQEMDYSLHMVELLSFSQKGKLAEYLNKLGYETEFQ